MKNKILSLTLCFTILMSSFNINNSYAQSSRMSVSMSTAMIGVIGSVAVASGIVLNDESDILDIARIFYDRHKESMESIETLFKTTVFMGVNGVVSVGKEFLNYCYDAFDSFVGLSTENVTNGKTYPSLLIPGYGYSQRMEFVDPVANVDKSIFQGDFEIKYSKSFVNVFYNGTGICSVGASLPSSYSSFRLVNNNGVLGLLLYSPKLTSTHFAKFQGSWATTLSHCLAPSFDDYDTSISADSSLDLNVPKDLSNLVGLGVNGLINPSFPLTDGSDIVIPGVSNPSIDNIVDGVISTPSDIPVDKPTDKPTDSVLDWVIGLVVPNSTYWSETFDTFFSNIGKAFPMLDISRFKDLCINGVPPKDIEVTIMGAKGKIFNTQYLNSIIGWLQPIVSAFMAFLLMLYNYRKVYKLIRGFEPFGGIADGNSVGEVRGKMDGAMPEMGGSSFVGPSAASTWSDGSSVTRGSIQSKYYGRDL